MSTQHSALSQIPHPAEHDNLDYIRELTVSNRPKPLGPG